MATQVVNQATQALENAAKIMDECEARVGEIVSSLSTTQNEQQDVIDDIVTLVAECAEKIRYLYDELNYYM